MKRRNRLILTMGILFSLSPVVMAQTAPAEPTQDKLVVIWTSGDPYVAERAALMYAHAAKTAGWFKEVTLVVWGPSAKLISENIKLQEKGKAM